jgi:hypothetical protein
MKDTHSLTYKSDPDGLGEALSKRVEAGDIKPLFSLDDLVDRQAVEIAEKYELVVADLILGSYYVNMYIDRHPYSFDVKKLGLNADGVLATTQVQLLRILAAAAVYYLELGNTGGLLLPKGGPILVGYGDSGFLYRQPVVALCPLPSRECRELANYLVGALWEAELLFFGDEA